MQPPYLEKVQKVIFDIENTGATWVQNLILVMGMKEQENVTLVNA